MYQRTLEDDLAWARHKVAEFESVVAFTEGRTRAWAKGKVTTWKGRVAALEAKIKERDEQKGAAS